jgi:uncharacterized protein YbjT (DUF2867 family)
MPAPARRALVTGVTGYVGSRLAPALLRRGWRVRVLTRHPDRVARRDWGGPLEVVAGDASRPDDLARACAGVDVAYYLLHSMDGRDGTASWPGTSPTPSPRRASAAWSTCPGCTRPTGR